MVRYEYYNLCGSAGVGPTEGPHEGPTKVLREKVHCRSLSSIHILYTIKPHTQWLRVLVIVLLTPHRGHTDCDFVIIFHWTSTSYMYIQHCT